MNKNACTEKQRKMMDLLEQVLLAWYGLKITDIPKILSIMGINKGYSMEIAAISHSSAKFKISLDVKDYFLEINRGDMINPYHTWCLTGDECRTYFSIDANLNVEQICSFDREGKLIV